MIKLTTQQECKLLLIIEILSYISIPFVIIFASIEQIITGLFVYFLTYTIGIALTYHRFVTHQSFKLNPILEKIFVIFGVIASQGSPTAWAALHRAHHKHSDTEYDSHSPMQGKFKSWFLAMYPNDRVFYPKFIAKLLRKKFYVFIHNHYFNIILSYVIVLAILDPFAILYAYLFPVSLGWIAIGFINVICHNYGYRNFETKDTSTNNQWGLLIGHGENLHNNHHYDQANYNFSKNKNEIDFIAKLVNFLKFIKLAE